MKNGDRVLVYSLQSFHGGGFLNGAPGYVVVEPDGVDDSVIVCVERKKNGSEVMIDNNYEVYPGQCKVIPKENWPATKRMRQHRKLYKYKYK